ncbi:PREDICTED: tumor suppressor candidate 5 [Ceratotherium simum simum]|uniref:Tumor suppressor candidate 5 n=1 Tax=Ceratotherium simum simum TaxID=73337 RepID=A0ABM0HT95_CERSS|nr:PREDICTED: tumor suppressor candidate 5 [Ceratotherium simum simum]
MANPVQPQFPPAREPGTASPLDLPEMEKLLTKVDDKADKSLKLSKSLSGALDLDQNGHGLPFKVISEGHQEATLPLSPSRASSRRASSVATTSYAQDQEIPKDYLILAIASCFCPVWPLNLIPLIFSIMSRSSVQQGDLDGARRLGRLARLLSITFIIMGIIIIIVAVTVNFTGEAPPHGAEGASLLGVRTVEGCSPALWNSGGGLKFSRNKKNQAPCSRRQALPSWNAQTHTRPTPREDRAVTAERPPVPELQKHKLGGKAPSHATVNHIR